MSDNLPAGYQSEPDQIDMMDERDLRLELRRALSRLDAAHNELSAWLDKFNDKATFWPCETTRELLEKR